jgi:hypothetical protein
MAHEHTFCLAPITLGLALDGNPNDRVGLHLLITERDGDDELVTEITLCPSCAHRLSADLAKVAALAAAVDALRGLLHQRDVPLDDRRFWEDQFILAWAGDDDTLVHVEGGSE